MTLSYVSVCLIVAITPIPTDTMPRRPFPFRSPDAKIAKLDHLFYSISFPVSIRREIRDSLKRHSRMQTNYECQIRCNALSCGKKERGKELRILFLSERSEEVKTKLTTKSRSVAGAVHAVASVRSRLVVSASGEIRVVVEGVSADVRVVTVRKKFLNFPVVGALAYRELEILLGNGVPELYKLANDAP